MSFTLIPAIDLRGGRCVRLLQGRLEDETVFSGKQRRATARYTCYGLRNFWSMDSLVTG